jgi:hypothetical protein
MIKPTPNDTVEHANTEAHKEANTSAFNESLKPHSIQTDDEGLDVQLHILFNEPDDHEPDVDDTSEGGDYGGFYDYRDWYWEAHVYEPWPQYREWLKRDWNEFAAYCTEVDFERKNLRDHFSLDRFFGFAVDALDSSIPDEDIIDKVKWEVAMFYEHYMYEKRVEREWTNLRDRMLTNPCDFDEMIEDWRSMDYRSELRGFIDGTIEVDTDKAFRFKEKVFRFYDLKQLVLDERRLETRFKWVDYKPQLYYDNQQRTLFIKIDPSKMIPEYADEFVAMVDGAFSVKEYYDWWDEGIPRQQELIGAILAFYDREEFWWNDYRTAPTNQTETKMDADCEQAAL